MPNSKTTSALARNEIVEALRLDLIGPWNDHAFANELLPEIPTQWYLTGYLVPVNAPAKAKQDDDTAQEELDFGTNGKSPDDGSTPDKGSARKTFLPSSMGLSVLINDHAENLTVKISWGDYKEEEWTTKTQAKENTNAPGEETPENEAPPPQTVKGYRRIPREEHVSINISNVSNKPGSYTVPNSGGLEIVVTGRVISNNAIGADRLPKDTKSLSVFLVNKRTLFENQEYKSYIYQAELQIDSEIPFIARPDLRAATANKSDWDTRVADLQYKDVCEYAVGHSISATIIKNSESGCHSVKTTWIPCAEVEWVAPAPINDVKLEMDELAAIIDAKDAEAKLLPLVTHYRKWITSQKSKFHTLDTEHKITADELLNNAEYAADCIEAGIKLMSDVKALDAFRIANKAMAAAARQRQKQIDPNSVTSPKWRPFQLAFFLMTMRGIVDPLHEDREKVDLLFFPTGGGKTEAYLGLAAFTIVLRRLRNPGIRSAGMSVLMRYTLRLLTLDQLGRASALICALELEREKNKEILGEWPFEIGLWVGSAATPNRMGGRGYAGPGKDDTAYIKTTKFRQGTSKASPIPIENCPWCGEKFTPDSFQLKPNIDKPLDLKVHCVNFMCEFNGGKRYLPVVGVDEPIYRRLPAFLIATIDKFAALPWTAETGALFGLVERNDKDGFYGPSIPGVGMPIEGGDLPAPDLIIQDELHLISGPLGTIAGVYETTIDILSTRKIEDRRIRPKIIASTATVRRADTQIRALFERDSVRVFPPPGPNRRDSFFAETQPSSEIPARVYLGIAAQGKSLKVVLLRAALALLSSAKTIYDREGGGKNKTNPVDPYMTLLGYFNSLRELGGSRRIIEDEVTARLTQYSARKRLDPVDNLFANRNINYEVLELTSRVATNDVAGAKRRLSVPFYDKDHVDTALATNMISVGLDIIRLGLMTVLGQPKTSAEYIQATSRVGRDPNRPGLIITLLNIHKPRDRSHYERFESWHASFYRGVEATSVTPFSPRALDKALPAALTGLCRHGNKVMEPSQGAREIISTLNSLQQFASQFADRAANHQELDSAKAKKLSDSVRNRCLDLLDYWRAIADKMLAQNSILKYQEYEEGSGLSLLHDFLDSELQNLPQEFRHFRAGRSMRDVEDSVDLNIKNLNDWSNP